MQTNLFLLMKENVFELTKLSLLQRHFFFDRISKKPFKVHAAKIQLLR